jgi:hypothetical protein
VVFALTGFAMLAAGKTDASQIDSATFFLLRTGMSESDILIRAGSPDLVTMAGGERVEVISGSVGEEITGRAGFDVSRTVSFSNIMLWHYIPDRSEFDPHLTVITMKGGRVADIEREKVFSRDRLPEPPSAASPTALSDREIVRRRLERTLRAAEQYARIRDRLKKDGLDAGQPADTPSEVGASGSDFKIYHGLDADGRVYYGDRPPGTPPSLADY